MDLDRLSRALGCFAVLEPTHFPSHFALVFLFVADQDRPVRFREIEEALNLSASAVSRTVMALGKTNRKGQPGFDLLATARDPGEGRRFVAMLTARGHALKRQIEAV